ncbi:MAG: hypothetical protein EOP06_12455 [Proteobacteria bacterium]|nr:MAG: hypothetical protein EOP06_12455 [Pseudomonadota bacterium]
MRFTVDGVKFETYGGSALYNGNSHIFCMTLLMGAASFKAADGDETSSVIEEVDDWVKPEEGMITNSVGKDVVGKIQQVLEKEGIKCEKHSLVDTVDGKKTKIFHYLKFDIGERQGVLIQTLIDSYFSDVTRIDKSVNVLFSMK